MNVSPLEHERRLSIDSTMVNFGDDADPPPYDLPAHEIMLDGIEPEGGGDLEMIERPHESFVGSDTTKRRDSNTTMADMVESQNNERRDGRDSMDTKDSV